jgi:hypothetical protein
MKEEARGFPTAWGSIGLPLHSKALEVSENEKHFGKCKLAMAMGAGNWTCAVRNCSGTHY